jgi:EAL domain-containing protein (putative c-di-GMP-specific phosphodiesterase class I)
VFGEACRQAALWPERIRVAVNVSRAQFRAVSIVPVIQDALSASGIAPRRLEIEINETALSQNSERNLAILHQLRDFGIGIALDDFGAGASSLSLLQKFPFDKIKVDRSLQVQGYLFGRPYPPEQAAEFLSRGGLIPARRKRATAPQETGLAS